MSETDYDYDVIVLGCGSAGSKAASVASAAGAQVLAVDGAEEMGGLCILRGCMPTKTLLETAHRLHEIRDAKRFGIDVGAPTLDFAAHMERMRSLVARFQRAKVGGIERGGYTLERAPARFTGPNTVEVGGKPRTAAAFVIATGSVTRPFPVDVPPDVRVLTSDDMFTLTEVPKRVLVVGGGAVGLEFAQWLARIGAEVVLSVRSHLLHRVDLELGRELEQALSEEMLVASGSAVTRVESDPAGARVTLRLASGEEQPWAFDWILNATGRVPNLGGLELERAGLDPADLRIGPGFQTQVPHIFVAGDATNERQILHEANLEGAVAGQNAVHVARGEAALEVYDDGTPPVEVIFTDPPVAWVGRAPLALEVAGVAHEVALKRFPEQGRGIVMGAQYGFVRLVAAPGGGALLGCQMIGDRADDLIHIPAVAMRMGGTAKDLFSSPWYHPTLAEAFIEVSRALA